MRALVLVFLLSLTSCDTLWSGYIALGPYVNDAGNLVCASGTSCDLAGIDGAMGTPCSSDAMCSAPTPFCDLNTLTCAPALPPAEGFPVVFETSIPLSHNYMFMATGNFDGDGAGVADVAVSGSFTGANINSNGANPVPLDIYLGDGNGGLRADGSCPIPSTEKVVYLLTVTNPTNPQFNDLLVATLGQTVYRCSRLTGGWMQTPVPVSGGIDIGFKQLALANDEIQPANPDLLIRTSTNRYVDNTGTTGSLYLYRATGPLNFGGGLKLSVSTSDVTWVMPYRYRSAAGDSLLTTWDDPMAHPGVEAYYVTKPGQDVVRHDGAGPMAADFAGTPYTELKGAGPAGVALAALATLHVVGQPPYVLFSYSQSPNGISLMDGNMTAGATNNGFALQYQGSNLTIGGLLLPYTGDANDDGNDEVGLYTMAVNGNPLTRHLQVLSYASKLGLVQVGNPIEDIANPTENFRGMALEYLGNLNDRRRSQKRKDLIALLETPGGTSRLIVRRANLNYPIP